MKLQVNVSDALDQHIEDLIEQTVNRMMADMQHSSKYADYLNLGEAANYLTISRGTLTKVIEESNIPVTYIGRSARIKKTDLDAYMANKAV